MTKYAMYRCIWNDDGKKLSQDATTAGQGRAGVRAKAAESLCAACLTKSKEKSHTHSQNAFGVLTDGKNAGEVHCAKNQRCMRKCWLCRKRAKSTCEGCCNADGKDVEQEKRASHSGSAGALQKGRGGEEEKETGKPAETFCFNGFGRSINLLGRLQIFGWFVGMAATGGIVAVPTGYPLCCCNRKITGGACPAPTARCFLLPRRAG